MTCTTEFSISMKDTDTAFQRLVGTIRRRDFRIRSMNATSDDTGTMSVRVSVESHRPVDCLARQLEKLIDVTSVAYTQAEAAVVASVA